MRGIRVTKKADEESKAWGWKAYIYNPDAYSDEEGVK